jgi:hypothetical protein
MGEQQQFVTPTSCDVLCGAGYETSHHKGNEMFRMIVSKHFEEYYRATCKKAKIVVSRAILADLLSSGARFLKKDGSHNRWLVADIKVGKDKISHALRALKDAKKKNDGWPHTYPPHATQFHGTDHQESLEGYVSESRKRDITNVVNETSPGQHYENGQSTYPMDLKPSYNIESGENYELNVAHKRLHYRDSPTRGTLQATSHKLGRSYKKDSSGEYWTPRGSDTYREHISHSEERRSYKWKSRSRSDSSYPHHQYQSPPMSDLHEHGSRPYDWDRQWDPTLSRRAQDHTFNSKFRDDSRQEHHSSIQVTDGRQKFTEPVLPRNKRHDDGNHSRHKSTLEVSERVEKFYPELRVHEGYVNQMDSQEIHSTVDTHEPQRWIDGLERVLSPFPGRSASSDTDMTNNYPNSSRRMSKSGNALNQAAINGSDIQDCEAFGPFSTRNEYPLSYSNFASQGHPSISSNNSYFQGPYPQAYSHFPASYYRPTSYPNHTSHAAIDDVTISPLKHDIKEHPDDDDDWQSWEFDISQETRKSDFHLAPSP